MMRTSDMHLAAFLIADGVRLTRVGLSGTGAQVLFEFDVEPGDVAKFYDEAFVIQPRKLFDGIKEVKLLIYKATKEQRRALPTFEQAKQNHNEPS